MAKRAWIVEPKLIDRFLNVLTDNDFKWVSGHKANEYKSWYDGDTILFIEEASKTISFTRHFSYPDDSDDSDEELTITEVTEEWLRDKENKSIANMEGDNMETQINYMGKSNDNMETLIKNVEQWAHEKEIDDYKHWEKQFMKFQEETFELYKEMALHDARLKDERIDMYIYDNENMKLEMGDVLVTLIVLAKQQDIELSECLSMAWNKIKDRRGKTINGKFVKEEDL